MPAPVRTRHLPREIRAARAGAPFVDVAMRAFADLAAKCGATRGCVVGSTQASRVVVDDIREPSGTAPPFSSNSETEKSTRKLAQQAPQVWQCDIIGYMWPIAHFRRPSRHANGMVRHSNWPLRRVFAWALINLPTDFVLAYKAGRGALLSVTRCLQYIDGINMRYGGVYVGFIVRPGFARNILLRPVQQWLCSGGAAGGCRCGITNVHVASKVRHSWSVCRVVSGDSNRHAATDDFAQGRRHSVVTHFLCGSK